MFSVIGSWIPQLIMRLATGIMSLAQLIMLEITAWLWLSVVSVDICLQSIFASRAKVKKSEGLWASETCETMIRDKLRVAIIVEVCDAAEV